MLSIRTNDDLDRALAAPLDPTVRELLLTRRDQLLDGDTLDLGDVVHFIVACRGDTLEAVEAEAGVPIATCPIDGKRFPNRGFLPWFEYVERHGGWLEAVTITGDDGFALVLFVADCVRTDPNLRLLLRHAMT